MRPDQKPSYWAKSRAYQNAKESVKTLLQSPKKILSLIDRVVQKSDRQGSGAIAKSIESIKVMVRLLSAYAKGDYKDIALDSVIKIVAACIYFVNPLDALPDFIAGLGLIDDAAIFAWTLGAVKEEVGRFLLWERLQETQIDRDRNKQVAHDLEFKE